MKKLFLMSFLTCIFMMACVSKKKYNEQLGNHAQLKNAYDRLNADLVNCQDERSRQSTKIEILEREVLMLKENSNALLNQLSDLSVLTREQAASIKKSIENISSKDAYIKDLQVALARKDSLNMALIMNLKRALIDENDQDIEVKVEGSAVFISISDKMLFKSGSYEITPRAKEVLGKVARVIKAQSEIQFMIEGHTDNKPIKTAHIKDNWDLSVLRATSVARSLQNDFKVDPNKIIAAGRSEYIPIADNNSEANRALNRRTRIVILPQLDQFFKLLEGK